MAIKNFIRESHVACQGREAITSITVTSDFADRLDYEASQTDMHVDFSPKRTARKILGVSIEVADR